MSKLVTYDLKAAHLVDYEKLYYAIESFSGSKRVTESCWLVPTTLSAIDLGTKLLPYLHSTLDRLFIVDVTNMGATWSKPMCGDGNIQALINS